MIRARLEPARRRLAVGFIAACATEPDPEARALPDLLRHTGGWDRSQSFDPMFRPGEAAVGVGVPAPADAETVIRYMLGQGLDFDPGTRVAYSNFGYAVLGRVLERVGRQDYESFVRGEVLGPAGILRIRTARTHLEDLARGEVRYYQPGRAFGQPLVPWVFPGEGPVPLIYGGFYIEAMDEGRPCA